MYKLYLNEDDILINSHFPVIALLNEAANKDIIEFYQNISSGIGIGYDYVVCCFWDDLDEYEKNNISYFNGICIETEDDETIIIGYEDFLKYILLLIKRYTYENPDFERIEELNSFVKLYEKKFLS